MSAGMRWQVTGQRYLLGCFAAIACWNAAARADAAEDALELPSVVVTLIEQVDVPAQEAGVISAVNVREGQLVAEGDLLAQIEDTEAQIHKTRAELELQNARKQSENNIQVRFSEKARELADAELKRAKDSLDRYPKSISATELDRLRLAAEKAALAVEQAKFDFEVIQFAWQLREAERDLAAHTLKRRRIAAPLAGAVVEVNRRVGEWVEASETVFRILRMDRLRAEGFLDAKDASEDLLDRPVLLRTVLPGGKSAEFRGQLVFVSPEISPVNGQMRVWAEIENTDLRLRPGLRGSMTILEAEDEASE